MLESYTSLFFIYMYVYQICVYKKKKKKKINQHKGPTNWHYNILK